MKGEWRLISPIYNQLTTNIPKQLMQFANFPFHDGDALFPRHGCVNEYLQEYAMPLLDKINEKADDRTGVMRFATRVETVVPCWELTDGPLAGNVVELVREKHDVTEFERKMRLQEQRRVTDAGSSGEGKKRVWKVTSSHVANFLPVEIDPKAVTEIYDAVIIANGHYSQCNVPVIPGLKCWGLRKDAAGDVHEEYPSRIIHAKSWRHPPRQKWKILIIGAGISGCDIAWLIATSAAGSKVLLSSRKTGTGAVPPVEHENIELVHEVEVFIDPLRAGKERTVKFADGRVESEIDLVIFATGYSYTFPFLSEEDFPDLVMKHENRVQGLWQHMIHHDEPTLSFLGIPSRIVPFPFAEAQSAVVARFLAGRLELPGYEERIDWENKRILKKLHEGMVRDCRKEPVFSEDKLRRMMCDHDNACNAIGDSQEVADSGDPAIAAETWYSRFESRADVEYKDVPSVLRRNVAGALGSSTNGGMSDDFHVLGYPKDAEYINTMSTLATNADTAYELQTGENIGKTPPFWDKRMCWIRKYTPVLQKRVGHLPLEEAAQFHDVEDVLSSYEEYKAGNAWYGREEGEDEDMGVQN